MNEDVSGSIIYTAKKVFRMPPRDSHGKFLTKQQYKELLKLKSAHGDNKLLENEARVRRTHPRYEPTALNYNPSSDADSEVSSSQSSSSSSEETDEESDNNFIQKDENDVSTDVNDLIGFGKQLRSHKSPDFKISDQIPIRIFRDKQDLLQTLARDFPQRDDDEPYGMSMDESGDLNSNGSLLKVLHRVMTNAAETKQSTDIPTPMVKDSIEIKENDMLSDSSGDESSESSSSVEAESSSSSSSSQAAARSSQRSRNSSSEPRALHTPHRAPVKALERLFVKSMNGLTYEADDEDLQFLAKMSGNMSVKEFLTKGVRQPEDGDTMMSLLQLMGVKTHGFHSRSSSSSSNATPGQLSDTLKKKIQFELSSSSGYESKPACDSRRAAAINATRAISRSLDQEPSKSSRNSELEAAEARHVDPPVQYVEPKQDLNSVRSLYAEALKNDNERKRISSTFKSRSLKERIDKTAKIIVDVSSNVNQERNSCVISVSMFERMIESLEQELLVCSRSVYPVNALSELFMRNGEYLQHSLPSFMSGVRDSVQTGFERRNLPVSMPAFLGRSQSLEIAEQSVLNRNVSSQSLSSPAASDKGSIRTPGSSRRNNMSTDVIDSLSQDILLHPARNRDEEINEEVRSFLHDKQLLIDGIRCMLPLQRAIQVLLPAFFCPEVAVVEYFMSQNNINSSSSSPSPQSNRDELDRMVHVLLKEMPVKSLASLLHSPYSNQYEQISSIINEIYEHWLHKRSSTKLGLPLLRGHHEFMMRNWKVDKFTACGLIKLSDQAERPEKPERSKRHESASSNKVRPTRNISSVSSREFNQEELKSHDARLTSLKYHLDRARVVLDVLKRREKKKEQLLSNLLDFLDFGRQKASSSSDDCVEIITSPERKRKIEEEYDDDDADFEEDKELYQRRKLRSYDESDVVSVGSSIVAASAEIFVKSNQEIAMEEDYEDDECSEVTMDEQELAISKMTTETWSQCEDKMLLVGVAICGPGRWKEIRDASHIHVEASASRDQIDSSSRPRSGQRSTICHCIKLTRSLEEAKIRFIWLARERARAIRNRKKRGRKYRAPEEVGDNEVPDDDWCKAMTEFNAEKCWYRIARRFLEDQKVRVDDNARFWDIIPIPDALK